MAQEFAGTSRFQILSRLGQGGMGVVYEALDTERNARLALKTLRHLTADAVLRFKNEFRALADLQHPNLVSLGELIEDNGQWFFTMELIRGADLLAYVRPFDQGKGFATTAAWAETDVLGTGARRALGREMSSSKLPAAFDEARVRDAFAQLTVALGALHAAGKVHRDVKPSNVLVGEGDRVVLLDFGLVIEAALGRDWTSGQRALGTPDYVSPEQALAQAVGPEADLYSLGVVLYQALTGRLPFDGSTIEVLQSKIERAPPAPSSFVDALPADLEDLCLELLEIDPARRPSGREVIARLGVDDTSAKANVSFAARTRTGEIAAFVGRAEELARLEEAYRAATAGQAHIAVVRGESGVGKSALVRELLRRLSVGKPAPLVVFGRCYERESVPFRAWDGVIDALARRLGELDAREVAAVLPDHAALLAQVFPVLRRIEAIASAPREQSGKDPQEQRARLFAALRELFARLAALRPLVVVIDDLQWADADSMALLGEVTRRPGAPPMLLVATLRDDPASEAISLPRWTNADAREIALGRLPLPEASELVTLLLGDSSPEGQKRAMQIANDAAGHPLFIDEILRHAEGGARAGSLEEALWSRVSALGPGERALLELVAVAGVPLEQAVVAAADGARAPEHFEKHLAVLRTQHLVRTSGTRFSDTVEPYHDRIRAAVMARIEAGELRRRHLELARALEASRHADPEAIARHFDEAGERKEAAEYTVLAADQALAALAFDRAAALYRRGLELHGEPADAEAEVRRKRITVSMGDALAGAGRGAEAAEALLSAARSPSVLAAEAQELQRRAADQLMRSGRIDAGLEAVSHVLAEIGMALPATPRGALASLLYRRARLRLRGLGFRERDESQVAKEDLTRIDTTWSVGLNLSMVDTIRGADFQTRSTLLALAAGEPFRVARSLAVEAGHCATAGHSARKRTAALVRAATALAERMGNPHAIAMTQLTEGMGAMLEGRFRHGVHSLRRAESTVRERCTGMAWELGSARIMAQTCLYYLGEVREMCREVPLIVRENEERGDLYGATTVRTSMSTFAFLAPDTPDEARRQIDEAMRRWSVAGFHLQHYWEIYARAQIDLYNGAIEEAATRLAERWGALERSLLLRIQLVRGEALHLRARVHLAQAARLEPAARAPLLARARADGKRLVGEVVPWAVGLGRLVLAGTARLAGNDAAAREGLEQAIAELSAAELGLYGAAAHRAHGLLVGGGAGTEEVTAADRWMTGQSIARPDRMAPMLVPGFTG